MSTDKKPVIGVTMCYDDHGLVREGVEFGIIRKEYGQQIRAAGGQPIFIDESIDPEVAVGMCDGIVISGGEDINPEIFGETQLIEHILEPIQRTMWERQLIEECDKKGVRILGVCYGSQLLNIHYGGTIYQDIATENKNALFHGSSTENILQRVRFEKDFLSFQRDDNVETAHRHHQAVKSLAPGFEAIASAEDGVIEAIAGRGHFGVQWHSESDGTASGIYGAFIDLCANRETELAGQLSPLPEAV